MDARFLYPLESSKIIHLLPNQVFINFRGMQLRMGFVSHLVNALKKDGINVFIDEHETRGEDLTRLFSRIKESRIALVIFSSMYTDSKWCLDELEKIKECIDLGKLVVIPIFYKIKIGDVKNLEGVFGERFRRLARTYGKGDKWREAVEAVTKKFCIAVDNKRKESEYVDQIVGEVMKVLTHMSIDLKREVAPRPSPLFGIETRIKKIEELLANYLNVKRNPFDPAIMASSSTSSVQLSPHQQVFITFQGKQLRECFASHLKRTLERNGINVFIDNHNDRNILFSRIEQSRIALVIFSRQYTDPESKWCLNNLVKIKECVNLRKLVFIPIFYKVEPDEVIRMKGEFGYNFRELARSSTAKNAYKWKKALKNTSPRLGFTFGENSEWDFVNRIVGRVIQVLFDISRENDKKKPPISELAN